jgi:hypothetical protein
MKMKNVIWRQYYWTISVTVLLAALAGSGFKDTKHPVEEWAVQVVKSIYPIEKVGVIARSVTFPQVLNQGQAIIDTRYPNASLLCMDVANYSGLVTGLIWSMDRALVEEYGLQHFIDRASITFLTCVRMLLPLQVANPDRVIAASPEIEEKTPALSMEDAKKAVVTQIEKIQAMIRFAQTVESKQSE